MERRRNFGLGSVVSIIIGVLTAAGLVVGGLAVRSLVSPHEDGVTVTGVLVAERVRQPDGSVAEVPSVEFVDPSTGRTTTVVDFGTIVTGGDIGDSRDVSLIPGDPSSARVVGQSILWLSLVFSGVVVLAGVVGAVWWSSRSTGPVAVAAPAHAMSLPEQTY